MDLGLKDRVALVTGGSSGIGRATALALAAEGCRVAICARGVGRMNQVVQEISDAYGGGRALAVQADALWEAEILRTVVTVHSHWGALDVLVNYVGGGGGRVEHLVEDAPVGIWQKVYALNAGATTLFTMAAIPHMRRQGWGRVVTITSLQGHEGGGRPWYAMAKRAQTALMKSLAMDPGLAHAGITFNCVAPGAVIWEGNEWDFFRRTNPEGFATYAAARMGGRLGAPEEVANLVVLVCSQQASRLNGASIPLDGGESKSFGD